jgi:hypothetical protein
VYIVPSDDRRARFLLANQHAIRVAVDAVTTVIGFGGMAALQPDHPLQAGHRAGDLLVLRLEEFERP